MQSTSNDHQTLVLIQVLMTVALAGVALGQLVPSGFGGSMRLLGLLGPLALGSGLACYGCAQRRRWGAVLALLVGVALATVMVTLFWRVRAVGLSFGVGLAWYVRLIARVWPELHHSDT